jgi:crotonobetainyl-CoA:carnitine CoA-transferase CaiB-like acyl-CoA transferase
MQLDNAAGILADVDWDAILVADMPRETLETWEALVETWLAGKGRAELSRMSNKYGMGLSAISEAPDVLADPHLAARGLWRTAEVAGQQVQVPGPLFRTTKP